MWIRRILYLIQNEINITNHAPGPNGNPISFDESAYLILQRSIWSISGNMEMEIVAYAVNTINVHSVHHFILIDQVGIEWNTKRLARN